jgi:glycerol uptake facilitator-like aquaporin
MKLNRAVAMEFLGTFILAIGVIGSGHMAQFLAEDNGLKLLINSIGTSVALAIVIRLGIKVSGSHFNPAVTLVMLILKKISPNVFVYYIFAQISGAILGSIFANLMFDQQIFAISNIDRSNKYLFLSEIFATMILLWIILRFPRREDLVAIYVPLWIFGAILFTSSTAFANPAISIGRVFTTAIVGIEPLSAAIFIFAQLLGAMLGLQIAKFITNSQKEKFDE